MSVYTVTMKTHSRQQYHEDQFILNSCIVHGRKPDVFKSVVGKRRLTMYTVICDHDDCAKIADNVDEAVAAWNKRNPTT